MKTIKIPFSKGARALLWSPREGVQFATQELRMEVIRGNGKVEDKGIVSRKLITAEGLNYIRDAMGENGSARVISGTPSKGLHLCAFGLGVGDLAESATETLATTSLTERWIDGFDAGHNSLLPVASGWITSNSLVTGVFTASNKKLDIVSSFNFYNNEQLLGGTIREHIFLMYAISEAGNVITAVFDRSLTAETNVSSTDTIRMTYSLNFTDGG